VAGSLRSYRADDAVAVLALSRRALSRPEEQVGNPLWASREELESELSDWDPGPTETLLVFEDDRRVVGFGGVEAAHGFEHADLFGPLVAPGYRGRKIGTRLLEASIERARTFGASRLLASVGTRNAGGRLVLENAGFHAAEAADAILRLVPHQHRPLERAPAGVSVRRASPGDLPGLLELYHEVFEGASFPDAFWAHSVEQSTVYVAEAADEAIGFVHLDPVDRWVYHLGVAEAERGRGVGAYLLSRALADYWSRRPGELLGLSVRADNVPALRLYRAQGFAPWLVLRRLELAL
jgi:ribosomal protein S18 acetylase RimI-like enzyme